MKIDFDALPAEERRIILVASDEHYRTLITQLDPRKLLKLAAPLLLPATYVAGALGTAVATSAYLKATWSSIGQAIARRPATTAEPVPDATFAGRSLADDEPKSDRPSFAERMLSKGELPIPHLAPSEAARRFRFDLGDPQDGAAYVLDPCSADHYLRPAIANERLAQEKVAAFMQIASTLGAKSIEIVSGELTHRQGAVEGAAPLQEAAAQVGIGARFEGKSGVSRQVLMEFGPPKVAPHVPEALRAWLDLDPLLRALVHTRLSGHPTSARAVLQIGETIDIDARIIAELEGRKIQVGGAYRRVESSTWSFALQYWPWSGSP